MHLLNYAYLCLCLSGKIHVTDMKEAISAVIFTVFYISIQEGISLRNNNNHLMFLTCVWAQFPYLTKITFCQCVEYIYIYIS